MIITIKCEKCGNEVEIRCEQGCRSVQFPEILENNKFCETSDVSVDLLDDVVCDDTDVDANLEELYICCSKCGDDITLYF